MHPMTERLDARTGVPIGLALAALMAATRGQWLAPLGQHLPDASLAVFLLAGFYLRPLRHGLGIFAALIGLATAIDLAAVGWGGVSAYCLSPAYGLLLPAYGIAWLGGRWLRERLPQGAAALPLLAATLVLVGALSEAFSSGGFYLFSGRFADPSLVGFGHSLIDYLPQTLLALFTYVGLAVLVHLSLAAPRLGTDRGVPGDTARR
jgi:hypothetical protein